MTGLTPEEFLSRFYSPPNTIWPRTDPQQLAPTALQPFLEVLHTRGECPLVLPRRDESWPAAAYYVICWDTAHAGRLRPLIEAAVAHHWCAFDGRVANLKPDDPVEASILGFVGPGTTYLLRPEPKTAPRAYTAIKRLVDSLPALPLRRSNLVRPIGRMLREFELALANGSADSSARVLHEIETLGGISHENLAYLQIRRLARLGQDSALLAHGSLPTIVYSEPPLLVREAVLAAWARVNLDLPLTSANLADAADALGRANPDVAMLVDARLRKAGDPYAIAVGALVAVARGDAALAADLVATGAIPAEVFSGLLPGPQVVTLVDRTVEKESEAEAVVPPTLIDSWLTWVQQLETLQAPDLDLDQTRDWAPAWTIDAELADAIDELPQAATDALLSGVAAFLEADDPNHPAAKTARALLNQFLISERFGPIDLSAICALLEIFLRASPPMAQYRSLLDDLQSYAPQYVALNAAGRVLDIADVVTSGPIGESEARASFVAALVLPLHHLQRKLSPALRRLASLVTEDVGLALAWDDEKPSEAGESGIETLSAQVLIYSLDEGCLARVEKAAELQWPSVRVRASFDKVGNPALRQHARNADLIVIATRRAAHAATGFITENADKALIRYADGSGSASMMRAVESGLIEISG
ncbi:hypothetical protein BOO86_23890 [Mycobacterium sp. CBMA 234]|uniref:hypothetical protein n=1 Tax=Mycolicibacterium sp. CBMA 234 TaxID=1918495 RepID=UPI0012DD7951|nr:hypothetical protein [Mycolicibacterium sp. CBMA 234]MUL67534.1 hypothetical protein [Mycolicibacterium sp. CBMA 234]